MRKHLIHASLLLLSLTATAYSAGDWRVRPNGVGPIRIGMTLAQIRKALHGGLKESDPDSGSDACFYVQTKQHAETEFMILNNKFVRADVTQRGIFTPDGIQVGDSEAKVRNLYGVRLKVSAHQYVDNGHYLTALTTDRHFGIRFETDGEKVTRYYAGLATAIEYVEGCL